MPNMVSITREMEILRKNLSSIKEAQDLLGREMGNNYVGSYRCWYQGYGPSKRKETAPVKNKPQYQSGFAEGQIDYVN